jgi:hypothetical protein
MGGALERICLACGGVSSLSLEIHYAVNARCLSDTDQRSLVGEFSGPLDIISPFSAAGVIRPLANAEPGAGFKTRGCGFQPQ